MFSIFIYPIIYFTILSQFATHFRDVSMRSKDNLVWKAKQWNAVAQKNYKTASDKIKDYSKYAAGLAYEGMTMSNKYINGRLNCAHKCKRYEICCKALFG